MEIISSEQNIKIKKALNIREKSRIRKKEGLFLVDGFREINEAILAGFSIIELFLCPELSEHEFKLPANIVTEKIFRKICYKKKPDGCLAVLKSKEYSLESLSLSKQPLVLVLESVEKPGNLGAIIRTAYAAGVEAIIINNQQTDIYNPNVIRASQGLIFKIPIIVCDLEETKTFLKLKKFNIFATALKGAKDYTDVDFKKASAILVGTEADGLSNNWLKHADEIIKIPMRSGIDSLNVSVATAIVVFEALRQRNFDN